MNLQPFRDTAQRIMADRRPNPLRESGYIHRHGLRVARLALQLAENLSSNPALDRDCLYIAGLFHDVGKGFNPHAEIGAMLTRQYLADLCESEPRERIAFLVGNHCYRKNGKHGADQELHLLQDADILDHFGTQEVWLNFAYQICSGKGPEGSIRFWRSEEFTAHVDTCRKLLNFDFSITEFDDRLTFLKRFIARFEVEADGRRFTTAEPIDEPLRGTHP